MSDTAEGKNIVRLKSIKSIKCQDFYKSTMLCRITAGAFFSAARQMSCE